MERVRAILALPLAVWMLSLSAGVSSATTCIALPPLKPVHRICGVVFFSNGDRTANARVTVLKADKEIAKQQSDDNGRFSFDGLEAGKYEIRIHVEAMRDAGTEILLVKPKRKSSLEIAVSISLAGCHSFSLVRVKKLEAELNPANEN